MVEINDPNYTEADETSLAPIFCVRVCVWDIVTALRLFTEEALV